MTTPPVLKTKPGQAEASGRRSRRSIVVAVVIAALIACGYFLYPHVLTTLTTVSTDDAFVNAHATYVAPRITDERARGPGG